MIIKKKGLPFLIAILAVAAVAIVCLFFRFKSLAESSSVHPANILSGRVFRSEKIEPLFFENKTSNPLDKESLLDTVEAFHQTVKERNEEVMATVLETEGYYIMDEEGRVIAQKAAFEKFYPASMTKLMTALIAIERTEDLDEYIMVGELTDCYIEGSMVMYLYTGGQISMRDLLYALLMCSYNDAASAIAVEVAGSVEAFADLMNAKAQELGMEHSHFVNAHGLMNEEHYSCPYDITLLLKAAFSQPLIMEICQTQEWTLNMINIYGIAYTYDCYNGNLFLSQVYGVPDMTYLGGKTGFEELARSNFTSCFTDDTHTYYVTVMKALDAPYMTALLLDYYYAPWQVVPLSKTEPAMKEWQLTLEALYYENHPDP